MVDLLPTDEQDEIVRSVQSLLAAKWPVDRLSEFDGRSDVVDPDAWQACAALGWFGLGLAEASGGVGYTAIEESLLCCEIGASLAPGPWVAQLVATHASASLGDSDLTASLLDGSSRAAWAIVGEPAIVQHPDGADVVVAVVGDDVLLWRHSPEATPFSSVDVLIPSGRATLSTDDAERVGGDLALRATLLVAAMAAGMARATAEQSVQYGLDREQFGQAVGGFQAVKHRCADMAVRADAAVQQVRYAAIALTDGHDDRAMQVAAAHSVAVAAATVNAEINVQNHGGIGFTWEHSAHRFVTGALVLRHTIDATASRTALLDTSTHHGGPAD